MPPHSGLPTRVALPAAALTAAATASTRRPPRKLNPALSLPMRELRPPPAVPARPVPAAPVEQAPDAEPVPAGINEAVARAAAEHSLPPQLIHSVIKVESNYNPYAVSSKGALGLMQLIPETARRFGVKNVFNPLENIQGAARYLRYLLDLFENDYP